MTQETFIISKDNLLSGINAALTDFKVAALIKQGTRYVYDFINKSDAIEFCYHATVIPPKKFLFPKKEVLLEYTSSGQVGARIEAKPTVLFGVRPCDLNGIKILNEAFADDNGDPNYMAKLEQTVVIGLECSEICDDHAFCYKTNSQNAQGGYDVMLYDLGDKFAVKLATKKGVDFVKRYFNAQSANGNEIANFEQKKAANFGKERPFKNLDKMPEIFENNKHHPVWVREANRCLSCGSCIMVCPTCYCFDVRDEMDLDMQGGKRERKWDACMLDCFAVVVGNENFRGKAKDRLQHRINRKFNWLVEKHGQSVCVGCGRCVRACLAEISPKVIAEAILEEKE